MINIPKNAYVEAVALGEGVLQIATDHGRYKEPITLDLLTELALSAGKPNNPSAALIGALVYSTAEYQEAARLFSSWVSCAKSDNIARRSKVEGNYYLDQLISLELHESFYLLLNRKGLIKAALDGSDYSSLLRQATKYVSQDDLMKGFRLAMKAALQLTVPV